VSKLIVPPERNALEEAFPKADPGLMPLGARVLVQLKAPKRKSKGGIALVSETQETEQWNTQVGRVIALGPVAFHNRDTLAPWPEGRWCQAGDFVRVPKYGGDRWQVRLPDSEEVALFCLFKDLDIIGQITGDPLAVIAFI
jgi:co-chaperonin GroES (HSP10)